MRHGWRAILAALALALALSSGPARSSARGIAVEGRDHARLRAPGGVSVEAYANAGYRLSVHADGTLEVTSEVSSLGSQSPFLLPPPARERPTPRAALARALVSGAATRYQAVARVLGWVSSNIAYELERTLSQDADAVLARRSGYCTGVARLTVALLAELGIEAREVPGYVVAPSPGGVGRGFHRWVEVHYPDRGWVFSDPLASHHHVPATYVRLASEAIELQQPPLDGALLARDDQLLAVDQFPGVAPGIRVRRNDDRQLAAALQVLVDDGATGLAILEGRGIRLTRAVAGGVTTFVGLDPGHYQLLLQLDDGSRVERPVELPGRVRQAVLVPVQVGPSRARATPPGENPQSGPSGSSRRGKGGGGQAPSFGP